MQRIKFLKNHSNLSPFIKVCTLYLFFHFLTSCHFLAETKIKAIPISELIKKENSRIPASVSQRISLDVEIPAGTTSFLDEDVNIGKLTIRGTLLCDEENAKNVITLKANSIEVYGKFECGASYAPYRKKLIISLKKTNTNPRSDINHRGFLVQHEGVLALFGDTNKTGWYYLKQHANVNDTFIIVDTTVSLPKMTIPTSKTQGMNYTTFEKKLNWNIGDTIVLGPTAYNPDEAESFIITGIDPMVKNKFYLDKPVKYFHWGKKQYFPTASNVNFEFNERAEVANLSRSIVIKSDEEDETISEADDYNSQIGAHLMIHHHAKAYVNAVEFYKMGQAGVLGRYPFHWHLAGNSNGQFIKNSSIHHSFQRCIVLHQTNYATVQNNVCYNFKGHGIFLEDGSETNNKIIQNLVINAKAPTASKILLQSDNIYNSDGSGRFPSVSGIWISHPYNDVRFNTVSGSVGSGIWMSFLDNFLDQHGDNYAATKSPTLYFNANTAHSCLVGITWDGSANGGNANNPNNPNDKTLGSSYYSPPNIPVYENLIAFKNKLSGIYFRGNTVVFKNAVMADNGWSFWVTFNQILKDSTFIGKTANTSEEIEKSYYLGNRVDRYRKAAAVLYDGPMEIHNTQFLNFSTEKSTYTLHSKTFNNTVIPFIGIGGTNKYMNFTSKLKFHPEPIHRMHLLDSQELPKDRQLLGSQSVRDLDGSLAKTSEGKVIVGTRSLGIINDKQCVQGDNSFYNFKICPKNYTESSVDFMLWGSNAVSPWATPFVVRRSDGLVQNPISEWNDFTYQLITNNAFSLANDDNFIYELLPETQYEYNLQINAEARLEANSEVIKNAKFPIIKIVAYGNNCQLENATSVNSLAELKTQTTTAYFSNGENFYVKLVPSIIFPFITHNNLFQATGFSTPMRHLISCSRGYLAKDIRGEIETVTRGLTTTTVQGWACNFTHYLPINVKLYAGLKNPNSTIPKGGNLSPLLLATAVSNLTPDPKVSMLCGKLSGNGKKFKLTVKNENLKKLSNHYFFVEGISNSGGNNKFIDKSGSFPVKPFIINENEQHNQLSKE